MNGELWCRIEESALESHSCWKVNLLLLKSPCQRKFAVKIAGNFVGQQYLRMYPALVHMIWKNERHIHMYLNQSIHVRRCTLHGRTIYTIHGSSIIQRFHLVSCSLHLQSLLALTGPQAPIFSIDSLSFITTSHHPVPTLIPKFTPTATTNNPANTVGPHRSSNPPWPFMRILLARQWKVPSAYNILSIATAVKQAAATCPGLS